MVSLDSDENGHLSNEMMIDASLPSGDSIGCDLFREQEIFPRVGANYQVEVPILVQKSEYLSLVKNVANTENGPVELNWGLPIPVFMVSQDRAKENAKVSQSLEVFSTDDSNAVLDNGVPVGESCGAVLEDRRDQCIFPGCSIVPGCANGSWIDLEKKCFLLGLYIFEKNFVQLRRFIESKNMGDILSFYYGEFYRSHDYCRWSECRKMRGRRGVFGQKIFTGLRQQELLSRLFPRVSGKCKNALLEVSKTFVEGKMSLEEYVFSLKAMVGLSLLVEVVGIGKGKQDLTGMALEPVRSNHAIPMRPEIPTGKACSSLTSNEIVKFLTGDYRLSKARSSDLFWEAVWPRLLARGWHSEEPKDPGYAAGSKNSLVFLVPGIKKFSRRRLVKGNHYFDSVSDVLSKVASEPGLIELENEVDESKRKEEEYECSRKRKLEGDDMPNQRRRSYLQPRTPYRGSDGMKFTIVDTGLEDARKVKELRRLLREFSSEFNSGNSYDIIDDDSSEVSTEESDSPDMTLHNKGDNDTSNASNHLSNGEILPDRKDLQIHAPTCENHASCPDSKSIPMSDSLKRKQSFEDKWPHKEVTKDHLIQSPKEENVDDNVDDMNPAFKRARGLTACNHLETSNVLTNPAILPKSDSELSSRGSDVRDFAENVPPLVATPPDKLSLSNSSKGSPTESVEHDTVSCLVASDPQQSSQNPTLIDLNIPQVPVDFETGSLRTDATTENPVDHDELERAPDKVNPEHQANMNLQRRGTRVRPPTTRALEALAHGYLTVNRRRKGSEARSRENMRSRPSRRARGAGQGVAFQSVHQLNLGSVDPRSEPGSNSVDSTVQGGENVGKLQVQHAGNVTPIPGNVSVEGTSRNI
ncbi:uncharacterized protein [Coffea arabica]|uniref:SANT domain-containing protein n=1 Tax=Coffea arabica TaxID=13443 RepID=A0A6P6WNU2_COFAR|nr:uncharacterized protein LOC113734153 isoform X2 [Coffea arabica]XP_027116317.1 uncharacterized protein LOC113734153 isoform X2 [Coffea arabica]